MILKLEVVILTLMANVDPITLVTVPIVLLMGWMDVSSSCTVTEAIADLVYAKIAQGYILDLTLLPQGCGRNQPPPSCPCRFELSNDCRILYRKALELVMILWHLTQLYVWQLELARLSPNKALELEVQSILSHITASNSFMVDGCRQLWNLTD